MQNQVSFVHTTYSFFRIVNDRNNNTKHYSFDQIFDDSTTQHAIYSNTQIDNLIQQVLAGFHATVFVYGQTGSGKTYTMDGYKYAKQAQNPNVLVPQIKASQQDSKNEQEGLIPRTIRQLFSKVKKIREEAPASKITVSV